MVSIHYLENSTRVLLILCPLVYTGTPTRRFGFRSRAFELFVLPLELFVLAFELFVLAFEASSLSDLCQNFRDNIVISPLMVQFLHWTFALEDGRIKLF
jgi:hypothetical protein